MGIIKSWRFTNEASFLVYLNQDWKVYISVWCDQVSDKTVRHKVGCWGVEESVFGHNQEVFWGLAIIIVTNNFEFVPPLVSAEDSDFLENLDIDSEHYGNA